MSRYRRKQIFVEAIKWTGQNTEEVAEFISPCPLKVQYGEEDEGPLIKFQTLSAQSPTMHLPIGAWIIKTSEIGIFDYMWPHEDFDAIYELAEEKT